MLTGEGALDRERILSRRAARQAQSDLLPAGVTMDDGMRFGAGMGISSGPSANFPLPSGCCFWGGAAGTMMWVDPARRLSAVLMTQFMPSRAWPLWGEFAQAVYADLGA
jgi:CubicO group peptidase (beta-lactamase class C family)